MTDNQTSAPARKPGARGPAPWPLDRVRHHRVHLRLTDAEMSVLAASLPAGVGLTTHVRDLALTAAATNPNNT
ncbi:hypothetical protein [Knoellia sp. LjRoot47]|uniref:hypothetical protein n=1 Tax=Knoellia sp. LjRoot47 TaxID=3342330 RepID=UPI003ED13ACC